MHLPGIEPERPIGDALDRCYTPDRLARAMVAALPWVIGARRIIEPSAGGGSIVRALHLASPSTSIHGVDLDPRAPARAYTLRLPCSRWTVGDWPTVAREIDDRPDGIVGNPPFGDALEHVRAALALRCPVALILPWAYWGVQEWAPLLDEHPPAFVRPIRGRPWPTKVRETAVYEWYPRGVATCTQVEPLRGYPR